MLVTIQSIPGFPTSKPTDSQLTDICSSDENVKLIVLDLKSKVSTFNKYVKRLSFCLNQSSSVRWGQMRSNSSYDYVLVLDRCLAPSTLEFKLENRKLNFSCCRRNSTSSRYFDFASMKLKKPFWDSYLPYLMSTITTSANQI